MEYRIEKLNLFHSNLDFDCGDSEINEYFVNRSFEDVELNNAQVYVFLTQNSIIGFYSISMNSIYTEINAIIRRWPICLLGQLGVNLEYQTKGWGSLILLKAIEKAASISEEIGSVGLMVQTYKQELINNFYKKLNFQVLKPEKIDNLDRFKLFLQFPKRSERQ